MEERDFVKWNGKREHEANVKENVEEEERSVCCVWRAKTLTSFSIVCGLTTSRRRRRREKRLEPQEEVAVWRRKQSNGLNISSVRVGREKRRVRSVFDLMYFLYPALHLRLIFSLDQEVKWESLWKSWGEREWNLHPFSIAFHSQEAEKEKEGNGFTFG